MKCMVVELGITREEIISECPLDVGNATSIKNCTVEKSRPFLEGEGSEDLRLHHQFSATTQQCKCRLMSPVQH